MIHNIEDLIKFLDPEKDYSKSELKELFPKKGCRKKTTRAEKKILMKYLNLYARYRRYAGSYPMDFYDNVAAKLGWEKRRVIKWYNNKRNMSAQNQKTQKKKLGKLPKGRILHKKRTKKFL